MLDTDLRVRLPPLLNNLRFITDPTAPAVEMRAPGPKPWYTKDPLKDADSVLLRGSGPDLCNVPFTVVLLGQCFVFFKAIEEDRASLNSNFSILLFYFSLFFYVQRLLGSNYKKFPTFKTLAWLNGIFSLPALELPSASTLPAPVQGVSVDFYFYNLIS